MKKSGFTLIELLVVIGIIATLTALALPNYMGARQRARDARKKGELHELKQALRLYYNDYNTYPTDNGNGGLMGCGAAGNTQCLGSFTVGVTTYMKRLPLDPFVYKQATGGDDFRLSQTFENVSDSDLTSSQSRCPPLTGNPAWNPTDYVVCAD